MQAGDKFLFDMDFDDLDILKEISDQEVAVDETADTEETEPEEEVITFTEEEMNNQRQSALEEGRQQGAAETLDGIENNIANVLTKIDETMSGLFKIQREENELNRKESISVASAVVGKLFSSLDAEHGFDEVVKLTEETLDGLLREPSIAIHVSAPYADRVEERLGEYLQRRDFQGKFSVTGDSDMAAGDCRIEWVTGSAERSSNTILEAAQDVITRNLNSVPPATEESVQPKIPDAPDHVQDIPAEEAIEIDSIALPPEAMGASDAEAPTEAEIEGEEPPETVAVANSPAETEVPSDGEAANNLDAQMDQAMPPADAAPTNGDQSSN